MIIQYNNIVEITKQCTTNKGHKQEILWSLWMEIILSPGVV